MQLTRCENGHFYYAELFNECPHCKAEAGNDQQEPAPQEPAVEEPTVNEENIGMGISDFAVGWLVVIDGNHFGEDFKLTAGDNSIGRFSSMDIRLEKDIYISRNNHAIVNYDPDSNEFTLRPGDPDKLVYHNNSVVHDPVRLQYGDTVNIGKTKLMFVPLCNENFSWSTVE